MMKKTIAVLLCALVAFSAVGCGTGNGTGSGGSSVEEPWKIGSVRIATVSSTEKIIRNVDYGSALSENSDLSIKAFRGEKEAGQIIITPDYNVKEYTVELADLRAENGATLSKSSFTVYAEKYVSVNEIKDLNVSTPVGDYPDALLPFEKSVEYGENNIKKGQNQGVWITLAPNAEQQAGTYAGQFTVKCDGVTYPVNVEAVVYDYTLSAKTATKSSFALNWKAIEWGELDATVDMQTAYYEFLLDHRMNAQHLPGNDMNDNSNIRVSEDALESFLTMAEKYSRDERCTSYNLPFAMGASVAAYKGADGTIIPATEAKEEQINSLPAVSIFSVDFDFFKKLLGVMIERSAEVGVDLLEKAGTYFVFFDEYDQNGTENHANYNLSTASKICQEVAAEYTVKFADEDFISTYPLLTNELADNVVKSVAGIRHKVVGSLTDKLVADKALSVPTIDVYDSESVRQKYVDYAVNAYGDDAELWVYTCTVPKNPYPTYHIEDALLSSRLIGWMNYEYNVVGTLYWETTLYSYRMLQKPNDDIPLQDYYGLAAHFPTANGDGYLTYPGRQYGIYGPVTTVRLESICDGIEDYDLLYALEGYYKQNAQKRGVVYNDADFDAIYKLLNRDLYSGTRVRYRDNLVNYFEKSRETLASLLVAAANAGTVIEKFEIVGGNGKLTISAPQDTVLTYDGEVLVGEPSGELTLYTVNVPLDNDQNVFRATAENANGSYEIALDLGNRSASFGAAELNDVVSFVTGKDESQKQITEIDGETVLGLAFANPDGKTQLTLKIDTSEMKLNSDVSKVTMTLYSESLTDLEIEIIGKCGSDYNMAYSGVIKNGLNVIEIDASALGTASGLVEQIRINVNTSEEVSLAIASIAFAG